MRRALFPRGLGGLLRRLLGAGGGGRDAPQADLDRRIAEADALRDRGVPAKAAEAYRRALAAAPGRGDLRVQLGNMLKDSGRLAEAEGVYREALAEADSADTHLQLGHVLKALGRRDAALAQYRQAVDRDPGLSAAVRELAEAGDPVQARRAVEAELRAGGAEALLAVSDGIARLRADLDRLARLMPDARARTAFPVALWDTFRDLFPVPPPPDRTRSTAAVVLLAEREDLETLFRQVAAVQAQTWPHWSLMVVGWSAERRRVVDLAATADPRVRWVEAPGGDPDAGAERAAAEAAEADWLLLLAPGATLDPQAIAWFGAAFVWSAATAFVCDEEAVLRDGGRRLRSAPVLRQAVDADSLLDANVFGETVAIRAAVYRAVAPGLPEGSVTAARTALLLRLAAAGPVGHVPHPLVSRRDGAPPSAEAHRAGVDAYLAGADLTGRIVRTGDGTPLWRPARPETPVAVLIPTRDNGGDLREMVSSLRATAAVPDALAIVVVDNGTTRREDLAVLRSLAVEPGVRVLRRDGAFNWSALNNAAAAATEAPLLVFANDDMRMVSQRWDERLRGLLERPDVGAVGARLLYDDDTVQHAGVLLGWKGSVIHDGLYAPAADPGPASRWHLTRAVGAVTGAFLALRRDTFAALGGFDAAALPVAYSDIDLCLRLGASGLKVLWTPAITLYHHESKSRGLDHTDGWRAARNAQERAVMEARWGAALDHDPSLNPCWVDATLPFRLLASPSGDAVRRYVEGPVPRDAPPRPSGPVSPREAIGDRP